MTGYYWECRDGILYVGCERCGRVVTWTQITLAPSGLDPLGTVAVCPDCKAGRDRSPADWRRDGF